MTDERLWTWTLLDVSGAPVGEPPPPWHTRFDAEAWLGEHWRERAAEGARQALLVHGGGRVGGAVELRAFDERAGPG